MRGQFRDFEDRRAEERMATVAEADLEYATNVGADHPERAWILSDRDVWYANPAYAGPPVPHPELADLMADAAEYGPIPAMTGIPDLLLTEPPSGAADDFPF
jgi:hypothetical protein